MPKKSRKSTAAEKRPASESFEDLKVVGIGASAGGLEAFTELVRALPTGAPFAYVLVQHLDPTHRSLLSELLARSASVPVQEVTDNKKVEANHIYVIPPNCDLAIEEGVLKLSPRDNDGGAARSIDHFLKSLAADQGERAVGVILSGAGSDGALGIRAIKEAGGLTFAQDEASSKYDSMPRSALATGCVDFVLPPGRIADELTRFGMQPRRTAGRAKVNARNRKGKVSRKIDAIALGGASAAEWPRGPQDPELKKIFVLLRTHMSIDFSVYRMNTVRRRLNRRMAAKRATSLAVYYRYLRENPEEVEALYQDLLIGVTSFFRNPKVFEMLKTKVFPRLVKSREQGETLRFWITGCSTGQEAYSYAIAFTEYCEKAGAIVPIQIFATDTNATSLEKARQGRYQKGHMDGLNSARLERYFIKENENYRVQKPIRDMVVFAQHNLLTDAPFTRVDLISCRNMLIYIEPAVQQKVIPTFHYALRPHGVLVLGTSESVGSFTNLFGSVEKSHKVYLKKAAMSRIGIEKLAMGTSKPLANSPVRRESEFSAPDAFREADRLTMARFGPPAVLVNEDGDILQVRGKIEPFLEIPLGKPTLNVLKMARGGLALILQRGLQRAKVSNKPIKEKAVAMSGPQRAVDLEIIPFKTVQTRCFLVLFHRIEAVAKPVVIATATAKSRSENRRISDLRKEFTDTRDHLVTLREQHETTVEELQASNEEVQSSNEELQSLNEELETSNEELESANEELTTLNEELATRNSELRESEQRLREQTQLVEIAPLLARSSKDRIIFWSYGAERLYGFTKDEAIGQISHLFLAAQYPEPIEKIQAELSRTGRWEGEVRHRRKDGTIIWVASQWVNHVDPGTRIRAVLEVCGDITERKRAEESLLKAQELNERILDSTVDCVAVLDLAGRIVFVNVGGKRAHEQELLGVEIGQHWMGLWAAKSRPQAEAGYRAALGGKPGRFEAMADKVKEGQRWWDVVLQPITDPSGHPERLLAVCRDVTEHKSIELKTAEEARLSSLRSEVAIEIARGGDLPPILQQVSQILLHYSDAASVRIWLSTENASVLRLAASAGIFPAAHTPQHEFAFSEGKIGTIASSKRPFTTNQVTGTADLCDSDWAKREGLVGFAGYPILFENRVLGVLGLFSTARLDNRLLRELGLLADAVALVIERKKAEDERNRLLMEAMEARNAALAANRAKDSFLATLSHELRTPLNPVLLLAADAAENPELSPAVRSTFETIRKNVLIEAKLIDDLLDLTRIAHGKLSLDMQPMDLNAAVTDAVRIVSSAVGKSALSFALKLEADAPLVMGDRVRLQQVFWNILNNAVKFTPQGGRIEVKTSTTSSGKVLIQIRDSGIGMREGDLARVFDAFMQIERGQGGLGLGLAISRQLIEKHNGTIHALSDGPGKGSTFEIVLPLLDAATTPPPKETNGKDRQSKVMTPRRIVDGSRPKRRILLIEDHVSTREALKTLLAKRNFEVTVAGSISEARLRIDDGPYDIVLSDLGLPDGNGTHLIKELLETKPGLMAIALSGYGTEEDIARSKEAGFLSHLTKPVGIEALDRVIAEVLGEETAAVTVPNGA